MKSNIHKSLLFGFWLLGNVACFAQTKLPTVERTRADAAAAYASQNDEKSNPMGNQASLPPPDRPKDGKLSVKLRTGAISCISDGDPDGYPTVGWYSSCIENLRFDMFSRISFQKDTNTETCLTMPHSVFDGSASWDYLRWEPCLIGDQRQLFQLGNDDLGNKALYSATKLWRINEYQYKLYVANYETSTYLFTMDMNDSSTVDVLSTVARPTTYRLPVVLQYGNQQIAYPGYAMGYDFVTQRIMNKWGNCLKSNLAATTSKTSSSVSWETCPKHSTWDEQFQWKFILTGTHPYRIYQILDGNMNALSVKKGWYSDQPFVASQGYVAANIGESGYHFQFDSADVLKDGYTQYAKNISNGGDTCQLMHDQPSARNTKPVDILSDNWVQRLWQIATTSDSSGGASTGYCGVCSLHTAEIISEIATQQFIGSENPPDVTSFLSELHHGADPIPGFIGQYPTLSVSLQDFQNYLTSQLLPQSPLSREEMLVVYGMMTRNIVTTFFPEFDNSISTVSRPRSDSTFFANLMSQPEGTIWYVATTTDARRGLARHAVPIFRGADGIHIIPTNQPNRSFASFQDEVHVAHTNRDQFLTALERQSTGAALDGVVFVQMGSRIPANIYSLLVSTGMCEGKGPGRRGAFGRSVPSLLNRCDTSGRCTIQ